MHRMNVDFPEPDGPMMHSTSPGWTSRVMPLSTSTGPNVLRTSSARTSGSDTGRTPYRLLTTHRAEPRHHPLPRPGGDVAARSSAETLLEEVLPDVQHARHDQVPQ